MIYFLGHRHTLTIDVYRLMGRLGAKPLERKGKHFCSGGKKVTFGDDLCVRWGSRIRVPCKTINSPQGITNAFNKVRARQLMEGKVNIPKTSFGVPPKLPFIWRPTIHTHGSNFCVIRTPRDLSKFKSKVNYSKGYFSEILDTQIEYRAYVGGGKVWGGWKKRFQKGEMRANRHVTGLKWDFLTPPEDVCAEAIRACQCLALDMGAVDIMVTDRPVVIEVNTTPTLSSKEVVECFAKFIESWM